ncbi:MAG: NAD(P)-dependent oxidoreductase [Bacteroidetes bacterium]|nr:NAD(P)-dependent oxidoreductase [Bacteroidota bacterium]
MINIVIHGASSFLGKSFLKSLISSGTPVHVIARATSRIPFCEDCPTVRIYRYKRTITEIDPQSLTIDNPVFFEFSWQGVYGSERNIPEQLSVNIPLIISSIQFSKDLRARHWIGIGSQAEYGDLNKEISESDDCHPTTLYGKSKLLCSEISAEMCKAYTMEHSWLRLFSVYGPDDNHDWLIPWLIKEMLQNMEINVTRGEQLWDYLFVDDISEMLLKMVTAKGVGIANLGSGKPVEIRQLIEKIKKLTASDSVINYGAVPYRPDQVMYMLANISRLASHLGWQPKTGIEEGLIKTIDFIKNERLGNTGK